MPAPATPQPEHPTRPRTLGLGMAAVALTDTSRALVEQAITRDIHVSKQIAAIISVGQFPTSIAAVQVQRTADQMHAAGLLKKPLNVPALIFR